MSAVTQVLIRAHEWICVCMSVYLYGTRDECASYVCGLVYAIHLLSSAALISPFLIQNVSKIYFEHGNIAASAIKWAHFDEIKWVSNLKSFMELQFLAETQPKPFWYRIKIVDIIDFCSNSCYIHKIKLVFVLLHALLLVRNFHRIFTVKHDENNNNNKWKKYVSKATPV